MDQVWVLRIARGHDYELDWAGVYSDVTPEILRTIGNANIVWKFVGKDYIYGYNVKWADKTAPQFLFDKRTLNVFYSPAEFA